MQGKNIFWVLWMMIAAVFVSRFAMLTTSAGDGDSDTTGTATGNPQGQSDKTFTQADLDRIVQERLAKERNKYADYDQLKANATKWQQHEDSQKSELEKAQSEAEQHKTAAEKALADLQRERLMNAFYREAVKPEFGIVSPEAAWKLADISAVQTAEDGTFTGVKEVLQVLVKEYPFLVQGQSQQQRQQTSPMNFANQQTATIDDIRKMTAEQIQAFGVEKANEIVRNSMNKGK